METRRPPDSIFNPSAFALFLTSVVLIATRTTPITWGPQISATFNNPPNIYLEIFLLGLVAQGLFLDDMGMRKMSSVEAQDLCEILEERSINKSTIFTTQLPLDHWSEVIADPVIADAIRDRLQHAALTINITGESYRGVKARKLASKKKDA